MEPYFTDLATAFVRGRLGDPAATIDDGRKAGLRLHKFKRNTELPRVKRVLGMLRGLAPDSPLDLGSGKGTFLWPLLVNFSHLPVVISFRLRKGRSQIYSRDRRCHSRAASAWFSALGQQFLILYSSPSLHADSQERSTRSTDHEADRPQVRRHVATFMITSSVLLAAARPPVLC
jgi:hypothetical protein